MGETSLKLRAAWAAAIVIVGLGATASALPGNVAGTVVFKGPLPERALLDRSSDPVCNRSPATDDAMLVAPSNRGLQNVVVELLDAPAAGKPPDSPVVVTQSDCAYVPRVQVAVKGQRLSFQNLDRTLHNVHAFADRHGILNFAEPAGSPAVAKELPTGLTTLRLRCDVHPWMIGWVRFADNGFAAVTDASGAFLLKNVPPGNYRLRAWHETLGERVVALTVTPGQTAVGNIVFDVAQTKVPLP